VRSGITAWAVKAGAVCRGIREEPMAANAKRRIRYFISNVINLYRLICFYFKIDHLIFKQEYKNMGDELN
jgi:hypothetical protein